MGKANRPKSKKSRSQVSARSIDALNADDAVQLLERLGDYWVVGGDAEFAANCVESFGVAAFVFEREVDADAHRHAAGLDLPTRQIGDLRALMQDMARAGVVALIDSTQRFRLAVACRLDEVGRSTPSHLVVGSLAAPLAAVLRTGRIVKSPAGPLFPWARFDITDAAVAATTSPADPSPFPGHRPGEPLWEQRTPHATPLFSRVREHGPWPAPFGSFAFFTQSADAERFLESGACGHVAWVHLMQHAPVERPHPAAVPCLLSRVMELLPAAGYTPFVVNTGGPRSAVGLGTIGKPYLRTVSGVWEVLANNHFRYLHPWSNWSREDTLHWPGSGGLSVQPLERSSSPRPSLDTAELSDDELDEVVDDALAQPGDSLADPLDGYLLVMRDTVDQSRSTWRVFPSHALCCSWLRKFEQEVDLPARIRGVQPPVELGFPAGNSRIERAASDAFQLAAARSARRGLTESYRTQDGRDLAAMCATVLRTQRVHTAGYIRDLAVEGRNEDGWLTDIVDVLGEAGNRLLIWLDETDALKVDSSAAAGLRRRLGGATWDNLDLRSRHFLATAQRMIEDHRGHDELDLSGVAVECGKALEVELAAFLGTFRASAESSLPHDPSDRNDLLLRGFLDGTEKLTLGNFGRLLRPGESASALRLALASHIRRLPGGDFLGHRNFASSFLTKLGKRRNPASHDAPLSWSDANDILEMVLNGECLQQLVLWKTAVETQVPPSALRQEPGHLRADVYRYEVLHPAGLSSDAEGRFGDDSIDDWLDEADAVSPEVGSVVRELAHRVLNGWDDHDRRRSPAARSLPVLQRTIVEAVSNPLAERLQTPGQVGQDSKEIAWRIIPGMLVGRTEEGIVVHFAIGHSGIEGDAHDLMQNTYDVETVSSMATFLAEPTARFWQARRGGLVLQRVGSPGTEQRLTMLFRRTRPPGGYFPVHLGADASGFFSEVIADLAALRYGPLRKVEQP